MQKKDPKTTALIFQKGKIICLGAHDEETSRRAARLYASDIKSLGYRVVFRNFQIINIVATCEVKFWVKLIRLNVDLANRLSKIHQAQRVC